MKLLLFTFDFDFIHYLSFKLRVTARWEIWFGYVTGPYPSRRVFWGGLDIARAVEQEFGRRESWVTNLVLLGVWGSDGNNQFIWKSPWFNQVKWLNHWLFGYNQSWAAAGLELTATAENFEVAVKFNLQAISGAVCSSVSTFKENCSFSFSLQLLLTAKWSTCEIKLHWIQAIISTFSK